VYVISVSGTKMYAKASMIHEFGMTNVSTYQVLDIQISGNASCIALMTLTGSCATNW